MATLIAWTNSNEGFTNLLLSFATLVVSVVAIVVSIIAIKYPYKKKLSFSFHFDYNIRDMGNGYTSMDVGYRVIVTNIGNQAINLKCFIGLIQEKFKKVQIIPFERIQPNSKLDLTEKCDIFFKKDFIKELQKEYGENKILYAYCVDCTNKKYKKRIGKIKDILKEIEPIIVCNH